MIQVIFVVVFMVMIKSPFLFVFLHAILNSQENAFSLLHSAHFQNDTRVEKRGKRKEEGGRRKEEGGRKEDTTDKGQQNNTVELFRKPCLCCLPPCLFLLTTLAFDISSPLLSPHVLLMLFGQK